MARFEISFVVVSTEFVDHKGFLFFFVFLNLFVLFFYKYYFASKEMIERASIHN